MKFWGGFTGINQRKYKINFSPTEMEIPQKKNPADRNNPTVEKKYLDSLKVHFIRFSIDILDSIL